MYRSPSNGSVQCVRAAPIRVGSLHLSPFLLTAVYGLSLHGQNLAQQNGSTPSSSRAVEPHESALHVVLHGAALGAALDAEMPAGVRPEADDHRLADVA